jgi:dihydroflavonol-4-reductase
MRVLVTGGTGFVGRNLLYHLHEQGHGITLLHRPTSRLIDLPEGIRCVTGDLTRSETIRDVCRGMDWVFHVAGDVTWGRRLRKRMFANNLEATRNLLDEAERSGVKRFVYTSSAAAVGLPDSEQPADETFPFNGYDLNVGYAIAKRQAEEAVLSRAAQGFPAVVVNPTVVIGIRTYSSSFFAAVAKGRLRIAPDGGVNLVDVEDVARGHLLAAEKGRVGERYLLGGTNLSFLEAFQKIAEAGGHGGRMRLLRKPVAIPLSLAAEAAAMLSGGEPALAWDLAKLSGRKLYYSSDKAARELGYSPTPFEKTVEKTVRWLKERWKSAGRG